ncbi:MAG: hypothetical protein ACKVT0_22805 [Planctomycetaceae bacterium]
MQQLRQRLQAAGVHQDLDGQSIAFCMSPTSSLVGWEAQIRACP